MDAVKTANFLRPLIANGKITDFRVIERSQPSSNEYRSRYGMRQGKQEWLVTRVQNGEGTIVGLSCEVP